MIYQTILGSAVLALGLSGTAFAASATHGIDPFSQAKITAADAVAAVESNSGGKVVELTLLGAAGKPAYQVTVMKADGTEQTFMVDARSGALSQSADVQATAQGDVTESGEGPNDADSANEDAN